MKASLKRRDYRSYFGTKGELLQTIGQAVAVTGILAYFFYRSPWALLPLSAVGAVYFHRSRQKKAEKARQELTIQFKECILSVAASLKAGYSIENAFLESRLDMCLLYGEDSMIYSELELIRRGLVINITLEEQLKDLAQRSGCQEILQFAQVFSIAKRNGGNITQIIAASAEVIGRQIESKEEMRTLLSGREMEQNIMKAMPFGILLYIGSCNPGYFDVLYHNWQGISIMSACLAIYLGACLLGDYIIRGIFMELCS